MADSDFDFYSSFGDDTMSLDLPSGVGFDSLPAGYYDYGGMYNPAGMDGGTGVGSFPEPPIIMPSSAIATPPTFISGGAGIPPSGGNSYFDTATMNNEYTAANVDLGADPFEIPPNTARSAATGGHTTGILSSLIGAGGSVGSAVLRQGQTAIPTNPRGIQTVGLGTPQGIPSQTLQPRPSLLSSIFGTSPTGGTPNGQFAASGVSATGLLVVLALGILLLYMSKKR